MVALETNVKVAGPLSRLRVKSLIAFKITLLKDMNEFTTHILEAINSYMVLRNSNHQPQQEGHLSATQEWVNSRSIGRGRG